MQPRSLFRVAAFDKDASPGCPRDHANAFGDCALGYGRRSLCISKKSADVLQRHRGRRFYMRFGHRLDSGCPQQFWPEFGKQPARSVSVRAVDLTVNGKNEPDHLRLSVYDRSKRVYVLGRSRTHRFVLERQLHTGAGHARGDISVRRGTQFLLGICDPSPDLGLRLRMFRREFEFLRWRHVDSRIELASRLAAAGLPAAVLNAKRTDRHSPGPRGNYQIDSQYTILLAALHNVARLDINFVGARDILDLEFVDIACLVYLDELTLHRLFKCKRRPAGQDVLTVNEVDREIFMRVRTGKIADPARRIDVIRRNRRHSGPEIKKSNNQNTKSERNCSHAKREKISFVHRLSPSKLSSISRRTSVSARLATFVC